MNVLEIPDALRAHVGCSIVYESPYPTPKLMVIYPGNNHRLIEQQRTSHPEMPIHKYIDGFGNQIWRLVAPMGLSNIECLPSSRSAGYQAFNQ